MADGDEELEVEVDDGGDEAQPGGEGAQEPAAGEAAVDVAAQPPAIPSTAETEDVLAAVAASGGANGGSGDSVETGDRGEGGGEPDGSGGPSEAGDKMETDEQGASEGQAEEQGEQTEARAEQAEVEGEASEAPANADDAAPAQDPKAAEEPEVAPTEHAGAQAEAESAGGEESDKAAEVAIKVEQEPAATPAVHAGAGESAGAGKGSGGGGKGTLAVDLAALGRGGGLMGDDDEVFMPQVALAPSLSQYTAKAKEASGKVELNKYDIEAWKVLISEVQTGAMKHLAGEVYERVLQVFPTSGRHWLSYANTFVAENKKPKAIGVLQRALPHCPHVDLWRAFLIHYVGLTKDHGEVAKAYERAVECIGQDIAANAVWSDYIAFLKNAKASNQYEKSINMNQLRRAYQRALLVPMHQMERLWTDYEEWEKSVDPTNPNATEALIRDWEPKHKAARASFKERKKLRDAIAAAERASSVLSVLPGPCTGDKKEKAVMDAWMALINFEKSNPQKMAAEDLRKRVSFTLKQALSYLPLYGEVWYQAANWQAEIGDVQGEIKTLNKALAIKSDSLLLHLALAEKHELAGNVAGAKQAYETMCKNLPGPLVYIHYMRFSRRCEGMQEARTVFKRARKEPAAKSWELFADAALLEFVSNKQPVVARNIFELGLKEGLGSELQYVLKYLEFLTSTNDDNNTRVAFEKVLSDDNGLSPQHALQVWNKFVEFEYSRGNLSAMHMVEKRRALAYPEVFTASGLAQVARRFRFEHLWPCTDAELVLLGVDRDPAPSSSALGSVADTGKKSGGAGRDGGGGRGEKTDRDRAEEAKRVPVSLPPMARALQEFVDALPHGPLPQGMPGPSPDDMINLLNQMMIPPQFYTPPSTMRVVSSKPAGSSGGHGRQGGRSGKRGKRDDDDRQQGDMFRQRQKQRFANITD